MGHEINLMGGQNEQPVISVLQRVGSASVSVAGEVVARIGPGLVALVGVTHTDTGEDAAAIGAKIAGLRIFADERGLMNRSLAEVGGEVLLVSQLTLVGDVRKGRRPSFVGAAVPEAAEPLIELVRLAIAGEGVPVSTGIFGAHMQVQLLNDGPVTLILRTERGRLL